MGAKTENLDNKYELLKKIITPIYEGEVIKNHLKKNNLSNITVINSCAVTEEAEKKVAEKDTIDGIQINDLNKDIQKKEFLV